MYVIFGVLKRVLEADDFIATLWEVAEFVQN